MFSVIIWLSKYTSDFFFGPDFRPLLPVFIFSHIWIFLSGRWGHLFEFIWVEDEKHCFLFCRKYTNLRITFFNKLNLKIPVLKPYTNDSLKLLYELMNPSSVVDLDLDMYVAGPFSIYATGRELGMNVSPNEKQLSWNCSLSQHTQHFLQDGSSQLSSLGKKNFWTIRCSTAQSIVFAFAIVLGLPVYNIFEYTVCQLLWFDLAFTPDWSQIVMTLQCWYQPLGHLVEKTPNGWPSSCPVVVGDEALSTSV